MTVVAAEATLRRLTIGEPGLITALADRDGCLNAGNFSRRIEIDPGNLRLGPF